MKPFLSLLVVFASGCLPTDPLAPYCAAGTPCALTSAGEPTQDTSRACVPGKMVCENGLPVACAGFQQKCERPSDPTLETCNGLDDDDDGQVDEGVATSFFYPEDQYPDTLGKGACSPGYRLCQDGRVLDIPARTPAPEVCDNQVDDDCDGSTDESAATTSVAIHFVVDFSGSMAPYLSQVVYQSCLAADTLESEYPGSSFAITAYGTDRGGDEGVFLIQSFVDSTSFCAALERGDRGGDTEEYPLDACLVADDLEWPPDSLRFIVLFSDETVKSIGNLPDTYNAVRAACVAGGYKIVVYAVGETLADFRSITDGCGGLSPLFLELFYADSLEQLVRPDCSQ